MLTARFKATRRDQEGRQLKRTNIKMYLMKKISRFIGKSTECCLLPRTLSNTVMKAHQESTLKDRAVNVKASLLHSHTKFMEASSNMVNINEVNAISVFDLQSEYGKAKAKALGKNKALGIA